jgi:hypothetical protein
MAPAGVTTSPSESISVQECAPPRRAAAAPPPDDGVRSLAGILGSALRKDQWDFGIWLHFRGFWMNILCAAGDRENEEIFGWNPPNALSRVINTVGGYEIKTNVHRVALYLNSWRILPEFL